MPLSFDEAPPILRDHDAEAEPLAVPVAVRTSLSVVSERTRPLRVVFAGSGRRAHRLAERASSVGGIALAGVASPHAPDTRGWWGSTPVFRDLADAIEAVDPEAVIIAAANAAHAELVEVCGGLPVLLEKPVATRGATGWVCVAIQELFEPGLADVLSASGDVTLRRRCPSTAPDAPRAWGHAPLFETLHHLLSIPVVMRGPIEEVQTLNHRGRSRPEMLRATLGMAAGRAEIIFDASAETDSLEVIVGERRWERRGREVRVDGELVEVRRGAEERMMAAFRDAVLSGGEAPVPLARGVAIEASTHLLVNAFAAAGAPLVRPTEPKHSRARRNPSGGTGR